MRSPFRRLEINGGRVMGETDLRLTLDSVNNGYADAQVDDYGGRRRRDYLWRPGTRMSLSARFSHEVDALVGTAGFGFWNAPFGDPTVRRPALPQAAWFFYASQPSDLPFPAQGPGRGWFVATIDAFTPWSAVLAPLALPILALNNVRALRQRIWPAIRRRLGISFAPVPLSMSDWHRYELRWRPGGCCFYADDALLYESSFSPAGPLGFVCWLDNQYMAATPNGRFRWGTQSIMQTQWLEIADLQLEMLPDSAAARF